MKITNINDYQGNFFKILETTSHSQIGVMTLKPNQDSGPEDIHKGDQIIYVINGTATLEVDHQAHSISAGHIATIPANAQHHIYNNDTEELFFLTIYAPPSY